MYNFITGLTGWPGPAYLAHMEPGSKAQPRLAVSLYEEDERLLTALKHHLEAKGGKRLSASEVVRQSIKCLAQSEGLA